MKIVSQNSPPVSIYFFLPIIQDKIQVDCFGSSVLETLGECSGIDRSFTMVDTVFLTVAKITYAVQHGTLGSDIAMIRLLELATRNNLSLYEKNLLRSLSSMLNFLPKKKAGVKKMAKSELWSTYYSPSLTPRLSKVEENILLRWTNKAAVYYPSKRPDAGEDLCLGFGGCKLENESVYIMKKIGQVEFPSCLDD